MGESEMIPFMLTINNEYKVDAKNAFRLRAA